MASRRTGLVVGVGFALAAVLLVARTSSFDGGDLVVEADSNSDGGVGAVHDEISSRVEGARGAHTETASIEGGVGARESVDMVGGALEGETDLGAIAGNGSGSDGEGAERSLVRFMLTLEAGEDEAAVDHLVIVGDQGEAVTRDWLAGGLEERLTAGGYEAALVGADGIVGPTAQFEVLDERASVELRGPQQFDLAMMIFSHPDSVALSGADVRAVRLISEGFGDGRGGHKKSVLTDGSGRALLTDLARGRWRVEISASGHASNEYEFALPGSSGVEAAGRTVVDFGSIDLVRADPVGVRLIGLSDWGDGSEFEVAHTAEGDRVRFDERGEATLSVASLGGAELLKFWYPDGQFGIVYLDAGLPPAGEMYEADVRTSRRVEVALQVSPEVIELIGDGTPLLRVTFRTKRGDSFLVGRKLGGLGVHSVTGVHGERALVEFSAAIDGEHVVLATESIGVKRRGTTSCTLVVDHPPRRVRLVDGEGKALPGVYAQVREVGDPTSWLAGATTDESGVCTVPNNAGFTYSLRIVDDPRRLLVVDQKLSLQPEGDLTEAVMDFTSPRAVSVFLDGEPKEGIVVEVHGRGASVPLWFERTNEGGKTEPWRVSRRSDAFVKIDTAGLWATAHEFPFAEGENRIDLFSTASIRVPASFDLSTIRHELLEATLADWRQAGLLASSTAGSVGRSFVVPVGVYFVQRSGGEPLRFELTAGDAKSF